MYIKDLKAISAQNTLDDTFFKQEAINITGLIYNAIRPNYRDLIPLKILRRMGNTIKMALGTGLPIIEKHQIDAIIIGTAHGGVQDSIKFLNQIVQYEEGTLTPTNFVQSTPNAIAGAIAQASKCYGYNNTHTNSGLSFEGAILDAKLLLDNNESKHVLLGAVEEVSTFNSNIEFLEGKFKQNETIESNALLDSNTNGTVLGEGASMFYVNNDKKDALAKINDLRTICNPTNEELQETLNSFLQKNNLNLEDIDCVISGRNGDVRHQNYYNLIEANFNESNIYSFKNLVGEYPTVTAFAVWMATQILQQKNLPKQAVLQSKNRTNNNALIYNHHQNVQHSFILLSAV